MNMKTTKFLAVLAVFAMAFAVLTFVTAEEASDAATSVTKDGLTFEFGASSIDYGTADDPDYYGTVTVSDVQNVTATISGNTIALKGNLVKLGTSGATVDCVKKMYSGTLPSNYGVAFTISGLTAGTSTVQLNAAENVATSSTEACYQALSGQRDGTVTSFTVTVKIDGTNAKTYTVDFSDLIKFRATGTVTSDKELYPEVESETYSYYFTYEDAAALSGVKKIVLVEDESIASNETWTIPTGAYFIVDKDVNLVNDGTIANNGSKMMIYGNVTATNVYQKGKIEGTSTVEMANGTLSGQKVTTTTAKVPVFGTTDSTNTKAMRITGATATIKNNVFTNVEDLIVLLLAGTDLISINFTDNVFVSPGTDISSPLLLQITAGADSDKFTALFADNDYSQVQVNKTVMTINGNTPADELSIGPAGSLLSNILLGSDVESLRLVDSSSAIIGEPMTFTTFWKLHDSKVTEVGDDIKANLTITKNLEIEASGLTVGDSITLTIGDNATINAKGKTGTIINNGKVACSDAMKVITHLDATSTNMSIDTGAAKEETAKIDTTTTDAVDTSAVTEDVIYYTADGITSVVVAEGKEVVLKSGASLTTVTLAGAGSMLSVDYSTAATTTPLVISNQDETAAGYGTVKLETGFKGKLTLAYGSVYINGEEVSGTMTEVAGKVVITGSIEPGKDLHIVAAADTTIIVEEGSSLFIPETSTLYLEGSEGKKISMNNDGSITGNGTIDVNKYSQFYTSKPLSVNFSGEGTIIIDDATQVIRLNGKYNSQNSYTPTQKVIVDGNLTIENNAYIIINGGLEVLEGVTITVQEGGQLLVKSTTAYADIKGDIKSYGLNGFVIDGTVDGNVTISGTITAAKATADDVTTVKILGDAELSGDIIVNPKAVAQFGKLSIVDEGTLTVNGQIKGTLYNAATVIMNGGVSGDITIYTRAAEASVVITSIKTGTLTVTDDGMYLRTVNGTPEYVGEPAKYKANKMTFANISGVTVTEDIIFYMYEGTQYVYNDTYLNGIATIADKKTAVLDPEIYIISGTVKVNSELTVTQAAVYVLEGAKLSVPGTAYIEFTELAGAVTGLYVDDEGKLEVTGLLRSTDEPIDDSDAITAVLYTVTEGAVTYYFYTNLADAIASGASDLTILGDLKISKDTTIPAGLDVDASNSNVIVGSTENTTVVLTVADGGNLAAKSVTVYGTMYIADVDTGIVCSNIISDVSTVTEDDALYTNIYVALASAEAGEVVKITNKDGIVYVHRNVTIPEGVTLLVPANKTLGIVEGATLTVAGLLQAKGTIAAYDYTGGVYTAGSFAEKADSDNAAIAVTGFIESMTSMPFGTYAIPGAYYTYNTMYMITSLANSALIINDAAGRVVDVYGTDLAYGTVYYIGTSVKPVIVNVHGSVVSGTIGIEYGTLNLDNGKNYDMTIAGPNGKVTLAGIKTTAAAVVVSVDGDDGEETWITAGVFDKNGDSKVSSKKMTFEGEFGVENATIYTPAFKGYVCLSGNVTIEGKSTVSGNLVVDNDSAVKANANVTVTGTLVALEATGTKAAGTIDITGSLFVGGSDSLYTDVAYPLTVGADALVSGAITATVSYIAFPGATASGAIEETIDKIIENNKYTAFYVEDELFVTVYTVDEKTDIATQGAKDLTYHFVPKALENCEFVAWQYVNSSGALKTIESTVKVGESKSYTAVYALIEYNIYDVVIYTDAGVKAVSIDGIELYNYNTNQFRLPGDVQLMAGTHTVTYTMKAGYSGTPTLKTVDGTILKDYKFITTGTEDDDLQVNLQLSGTEPTPEPEPTPTPTPEKESEWNVTTILLLVLVILIAIMAVIVALRLNRN